MKEGIGWFWSFIYINHHGIILNRETVRRKSTVKEALHGHKQERHHHR